MTVQRTEKIAVLLATYNGGKFLGEQLSSIDAQTVDNIDIWLSDDGSSDDTISIAKEYQKNWTKGTFHILRRFGPLQRHADNDQKTEMKPLTANENFRYLMLHNGIDADFFAFCDQDDIWDSEKLAEAKQYVSTQDPDKPCLFCSRTKIIDGIGNYLRLSFLFKKPPTFNNAIVQNIAAGNTILMNKKAMELIRSASRKADFVSHDWWCYLMVTGANGNVFYSKNAKTNYRQHFNNLIGENASWQARMTRLKMVLAGRFQAWNTQNIGALTKIDFLLSEEARNVLADFDSLRRSGGLLGIVKLARSKIHRQTILGNISLYLACFLRKL